MFVFKETSILEEIKYFVPDIFKNCKKFLKISQNDLDFLRLEKSHLLNVKIYQLKYQYSKKQKSLCNIFKLWLG